MESCTDVSECQGPLVNPWIPGTAYVTTSFYGLIMAMGTYALAKKAPRRLPLYAVMWVVLSTLVRKIICCRCEFYGQECSTLMGKWTAMILEPDRERELTADAFYLDMALVGANILYPVPQVYQMGKRYFALYLLFAVLGAVVVRLLACSRCPNAVCVMNPEHNRNNH